MTRPRSPRLAYALATIATIVAGLASRELAPAIPAPVGPFVAAYVGDALWGAMVLFGVSTLFVQLELRRRVAIAIAYCVATELSQLYHAPWIDALRATRPGALVLGFGFLWSDVVAYVVGVVGAAGLVRAVARASSHDRREARQPTAH